MHQGGSALIGSLCWGVEMLPEVKLSKVVREDVQRLSEWLTHPDVSSSWFGADQSGKPLHIGYQPELMLKQASEGEWEEVFGNDGPRKLFSIYTEDGQHIGEAQMFVEVALWEAQLFVIIGRSEFWHQAYATAALVELLDLSFYTYGLHRAWVDIPDYNEAAHHMCERIGFQVEGHLRGTHPKDGKWYDSLAMGLLSNEYPRRRARLTDRALEPDLWSGPQVEGPYDQEPTRER